jgi:hypothetical protein
VNIIKRIGGAFVIFFPVTLLGLLGIPLMLYLHLTKYETYGTSGFLGVYICVPMVLLSIVIGLVTFGICSMVTASPLAFITFFVGYTLSLIGQLATLTNVLQ